MFKLRNDVQRKVIVDRLTDYDLETIKLIVSTCNLRNMLHTQDLTEHHHEEYAFDYARDFFNATFDSPCMLIKRVCGTDTNDYDDKYHNEHAEFIKLIYIATTNQQLDNRVRNYFNQYASGCIKIIKLASGASARSTLCDIMNIKINQTEFMIMMCKWHRKMKLPEPPSDDHARYYMFETPTGTICRFFTDTTSEQRKEIISAVEGIDGYSFMDSIAHALELLPLQN